MQVWPAIDLRGGKCVRLRQGDYDQETVFGDDPAGMARDWVEQGADRLHLVDLDGARDGTQANRQALQSILAEVSVPCQIGGGIRDETTIGQLIDLGAARLVVGTRAVKDPDWFRAMIRTFPNSLVLGLDARDGMVATDGWLEVSPTSAPDLARQFADEPIAGIVYTDIARDGMLAGPNLDAMSQMQRAVAVDVIASGGVTTLDDVRSLCDLGLAGCIVGRALYEGRVTLPDVLAASASPSR